MSRCTNPKIAVTVDLLTTGIDVPSITNLVFLRRVEAQSILILSGRFIGLLPCHIAERWVEGGEMRAIQPRTYSFDFQHFIAHRRAADHAPVVRAFLDSFEQPGPQHFKPPMSPDRSDQHRAGATGADLDLSDRAG